MNIGIKARTKAITQMRPMRARRMAKGKNENDDKSPAIGASPVTELSVSGEEPYDLVDRAGDAAEGELPALEVAAEVHVGE